MKKDKSRPCPRKVNNIAYWRNDAKKTLFGFDVPVPPALYAAALLVFSLGFLLKTIFSVCCGEITAQRWDSLLKDETCTRFVQEEEDRSGSHPTDWYLRLKETGPEKLKKKVENGIPSWSSCLQSWGINQKLTWVQAGIRSQRDLDISNYLLRNLEKRLSQYSEDLSSVRQRYQEEVAINRDLKRKNEEISSVKRLSGWSIAGELSFYILIFVLFWISSINLYKMSLRQSSSMVFARWKSAFAAFVILFTVTDFVTLSLTNIFNQNKLWIGTTIFFMSRMAWLFEQISLLGLNMFIAIPITQLWSYTRSNNIPTITSPTLSSTQRKFDHYISFMQVWTTISIGIVALFSIVLIKWSVSHQDKFEDMYLIVGVCAWGVLLLLIGRMIRNAMIIRNDYLDTVSAMHANLENVEGVMPDPTIPFIGENWWKLPATFLGILSGVWAMFEFTGISGIIKTAFK